MGEIKNNKWSLGQASWDFGILGRGSNRILTAWRREARIPPCRCRHASEGSLPVGFSHHCDVLGREWVLIILCPWLLHVCPFLPPPPLFPFLCTTAPGVLDDHLPWSHPPEHIFLESLSYMICSYWLLGRKKPEKGFPPGFYYLRS